MCSLWVYSYCFTRNVVFPTEVKGLIDGAKDTNLHSPITHTVYSVLSSTVQLLIRNIKDALF